MASNSTLNNLHWLKNSIIYNYLSLYNEFIPGKKKKKKKKSVKIQSYNLDGTAAEY